MMKKEKYIDLLKQMLAIPSVSREEDTRSDFLFAWLKKEGFKVKRQVNNLIITGGNDPAKATLLLNSHIDTVPAGNGWDTDPFIPSLKNGRIAGLGSNDAGASVVGLIACYTELQDKNLGSDTVLVLSAEEEISGENGISSVLPLLPSLKFGVVGEPTGMEAAVAERGLMVLDATIFGTTGHAARNEGDNAIYKAINDILRLQEISFHDHSAWLNDPSVTVTVIQAGSKHNVVPGKCEFVIDVRSNDKYSNERMLDILSALCKSELKPRSMRLRSSALPEKHPVFQVLIKDNLRPFGSPTLSDMALMSFPTLKIGPGNSSRSHAPNEFISIEELESGIDIYSTLVSKIVKLEL